jgi:hypothetical protein
MFFPPIQVWLCTAAALTNSNRVATSIFFVAASISLWRNNLRESAQRHDKNGQCQVSENHTLPDFADTASLLFELV